MLKKRISNFARARIINPWHEWIESFTDQLSTENDPSIIKATDVLREQIRKLPSLEARSGIPAEHHKWLNFRKQLRELIMTKNPNRFLRWGLIRGTMCHEPHEEELFYLTKRQNWPDIKTTLTETIFGHPKKYRKYPQSSGNLIHHAYCLEKFLETCHANIKTWQNIIEIGGGYGSLCRLIFNRGFSGNYSIYDLPEFLHLQNFFLSLAIPSVRISMHDTTCATGAVKLLENTGGCAPHQAKIDAVIAMWSLSEMPEKTRNMLLDTNKAPDYFLIAYQKDFGGIDNIKYFSNLTRRLENYAWHKEEIDCLPANYFLFGRKL